MTCPRKLMTLCISTTVAAALTGCVASSLEADPGAADDPQEPELEVVPMSSVAAPRFSPHCHYDKPAIQRPQLAVHTGTSPHTTGDGDTNPCTGPVRIVQPVQPVGAASPVAPR